MSNDNNPPTGRVTGLGGIFFKSADKQAQLAWYRDKLGINAADFGFPFLWREHDEPEERGYTVWAPFAEDTGYFAPSERPFMINFRVTGIESLVAKLKESGAQVVGDIEQHENGKFAWVVDPEGTKLELWEPVPSALDPYLPQP